MPELKKIKLELIKELIESVHHREGPPDKRTIDLSVQLARAVMERLPHGCGFYTEMRETLTEFLENFDY